MSFSSGRPSRRTKTVTNMAEDDEPLEVECRVCDNDTPPDHANKCTGADCTAIVCNSCLRSLQKPFYNCGKTKCKPRRRRNENKSASPMDEENSASDANSSSSEDSVSYCSDEEFDKATGPTVASTSSTPETPQDERKQPTAPAANSPNDSEIPWGDRKQPAAIAMAANSPNDSEIPWGDRKQPAVKCGLSSNVARVSMSPPPSLSSPAAQPKRQKQHGDNNLILIQPHQPRPKNVQSKPLPKVLVAHGARVSPKFGHIQSDRNANDQDNHLLLGTQHLANRFPGFEFYALDGVHAAYSVDRRHGFHGTDACNRLLDEVSRISKTPGFVMTLVMLTDALRIGLNPCHHGNLQSAVKSKSHISSLVLTLHGCGKDSHGIAQLHQQRSQSKSANNAVNGSVINPGTGLPRSAVGEMLHRNVMTKHKIYYGYAESNNEIHPDVQSAIDRGTALSLDENILTVLGETWTLIHNNVENESLTVDEARDKWINAATMVTYPLQSNTCLGYVRPSPPSSSLDARDEKEAFSINGLSVYQSSLILGVFGAEDVFTNPLPPDSTLAILNDHHESGRSNTRESFLTCLAYIAHRNIPAIVQSTQNRMARDPISNSILLSIMEETDTEVINALNIGQATSVDTHPTGLQTARILAERDALRLGEDEESLEALKEAIDALPVDCLNGPLFDNMSPEEKGQLSIEMGQIDSLGVPEHLKFIYG